MRFLKGSRNEFEKLKDDVSWDERAESIRRQLAEVFGAKNLSFLLGSGCSSLREGDEELGIPTMGPLAKEFHALITAIPEDGATHTFVNSERTHELYQKLGIDLCADNTRTNLEQMMAVLMNASQFCRASDKKEFYEAASFVDKIIVDIKKFILKKCTTGAYVTDNDSVVILYQKFYQSLATRARGLAPPWIFTTNYDLFNERAMDRSGVSYSNGFSGTVERRFNPATYRFALAEQLDITSRRWAAVDGFVHFCKLHGSVNWIEESTGLYPIRESHAPLDPSKDRVMIYPTPSKQTASFGSPYSDMFREFQRQVIQDQSVLVVMGFSFGDEHVNNIIFQGLTLPSFRLIAFIDPDTNDVTRQLSALGDPRIWFIWGEGRDASKKAHYFDGIVNSLLPTSADQKVDQAIEKVLQQLISKNQDIHDGAE
ncbi:SIR2 family protein [Cereibacter azotoformans]|uniref:SIR2-like protein n=1 Tax=Cereibacter azotoformans TaxID=43057 RepID=A0A2T5JM76_9RHOB|nr:SIR2 family protein [Cereibacter azotoformans]MBO4168846.1 SIR2 family protein [Cereibacter azotoformans]PTR08156.1 SIR2-like protein [Cereibacter azotoformans]